MRELTSHFNHRCASLGVDYFESLCDLVILEQFRNIIPERIAVYTNKQKVKIAAEVVVLADEFVLNSRCYKKKRAQL